MVYRGTWGPGGGGIQEKRAKMSFRRFRCFCNTVRSPVRVPETPLGPGACVHAGANTFGGVAPAYRPTDVLLAGPRPYRCAKCTLSPGTGDKCVAGPAPIICDRGDNHAPGGISTSKRDPCGVPWGPPDPSRGCAHPRGGVKNYPPRVTVGI